jgi:hypothetical protein
MRAVGGELAGKLNSRYTHLVQANSFFATVANEMHMVVVVMAIPAILLAEGILDGVVCRRDAMDDPFVNKCLQRPVNSYPVEFLASLSFYVRMRKCALSRDEQFQYLFSASGNAELISFQDHIYMFAHNACVFGYLLKLSRKM